MLQIAVCAVIMATEVNFNSFTVLMYLVWTCFGFVDTLGEGMTAMITKMDLKLRTLDKDAEEEFTEADEKKAFGNYYIFRFLVRSAALFTGGVVAQKINIKYLYIVLIASSVLMILVTLVVFNEGKVSQKSFINSLWSFK